MLLSCSKWQIVNQPFWDSNHPPYNQHSNLDVNIQKSCFLWKMYVLFILVDLKRLIWGFKWRSALGLSSRLQTDVKIPFCLSIAGNAQSVQVKCSRPLPEFIAESVPGCVNEFRVALCEVQSEWRESCGSGDRQTKITAKLAKPAATLSTSTPHLSVSLDSPPPAALLKAATVQQLDSATPRPQQDNSVYTIKQKIVWGI